MASTPSHGPVTLSQVAREAGVSLATASRAINGSANRTVREDLRQRVLEAAARLQYSPDANAQAMARGRTTWLGLIVHDIADPYFSSIAAGVGLASERQGLTMTLSSTQHDVAREPGIVELLTRQRARAIVVAGGRRDDDDVNDRMREALAGFKRSGGTVALVGQPLLDVDTVVIDNRAGAGDLARALHAHGYRRFGVLTGPPDHLTARDRLAGFLEVLTELGATPDDAALVPSEFTRDGGYEAMRRLLRNGPGVEVVFAVNDVMAVGAMAAARDEGVRVPDDVAVAGFDDITTLRDITPALSTVRVPLVDVGIAATELSLAAPSSEPRLVHVGASVVLRESTPPRG
ncbi:LacI family DNA-binding transcriptional regulator [Actinotalea ferrariae]|uniref:LacI family DNA-binding transcriptional regulator n=1 Tax=Actinotalea ferrariae TaxID=1386098 RepID=UPI001ED6220B|nr:LacI family DNA-binding transcriptional regulator [Actinotalea ferrariae]MBX9245001.1 LacI family DNA-binding transcriptional regulator [Actinotalea ferrariae]